MTKNFWIISLIVVIVVILIASAVHYRKMKDADTKRKQQENISPGGFTVSVEGPEDCPDGTTAISGVAGWVCVTNDAGSGSGSQNTRPPDFTANIFNGGGTA